jgi:3-hydroxyacyl-[acyl-carrier-protein] dehydratase
MRWMWIDRIIELVPREKLVAVKNVSLAEDHLHDHFAATATRSALPVMPASLIIEGMAQSAGILVGHAEGFKEKVILAKVGRAELDADATPGTTLRYTAHIEQIGPQGASARGQIDLIDLGSGDPTPRPIGRVDLMFSHIDQNMGGQEFPEHNFVFGESFKTLLRLSGIEIPG